MFAAVPILTFLATFAVPLLVWSALQRIGLITPVAREASLYTCLVVALLAFTYLGDRMARFVVLKWLQLKADYSKLFELLSPVLVRVYVYVAMATLYIAANIERFSEKTITTFSWWASYKEVLVEVLLTYVALDAAFITWKEFRGSSRKKAG
jgi:hypothetical protein